MSRIFVYLRLSSSAALRPKLADGPPHRRRLPRTSGAVGPLGQHLAREQHVELVLPKVLVADQRGGDGGGAGDQLDEHLGARVEDAEQQLERGEALLRLQESSRKVLGKV